MTTYEDELKDLILSNQGLIVHIIKKMKANYEDYDDLIQIGNVGLIKAAKSFDKDKGYRFATYASRCISNEILMYFRRDNKHKFMPSLQDILGGDEDLEREDTVADVVNIEQSYEDKDAMYNLMYKIGDLSERDQKIIYLRLKGKDQRAIGDLLGLSQSYISRIMKEIPHKLSRARGGDYMGYIEEAATEICKLIYKDPKRTLEVSKMLREKGLKVRSGFQSAIRDKIFSTLRSDYPEIAEDYIFRYYNSPRRDPHRARRHQMTKKDETINIGSEKSLVDEYLVNSLNEATIDVKEPEITERDRTLVMNNLSQEQIDRIFGDDEPEYKPERSSKPGPKTRCDTPPSPEASISYNGVFTERELEYFNSLLEQFLNTTVCLELVVKIKD